MPHTPRTTTHHPVHHTHTHTHTRARHPLTHSPTHTPLYTLSTPHHLFLVHEWSQSSALAEFDIWDQSAHTPCHPPARFSHFTPTPSNTHSHHHQNAAIHPRSSNIFLDKSKIWGQKSKCPHKEKEPNEQCQKRFCGQERVEGHSEPVLILGWGGGGGQEHVFCENRAHFDSFSGGSVN
jgi:hypothetical protein